MYDILFGSNDYPLSGLWIERNSPNTIDDSVTYEGAVPCSYRRVKNTSMKDQQINGLKGVTYLTTIRTKVDYPFKAKDKFKIGSKVYSIESVDKVENDIYKDARVIYTHFLDFETELVLK